MTKTQIIEAFFVSGPSGTRLDVLRESLLSRGIRPLIPEYLSVSSDWASETHQQLLDADLVIGVLPTGRKSDGLIFELGQAWDLRKLIRLIAPPAGRVEQA